jgi:hypothetical protein
VRCDAFAASVISSWATSSDTKQLHAIMNSTH